MEFTGERYIPGAAPWDMETEHLSRYLACVRIAGGLRVLDAACGAGYGTALLAEVGASAHGIDIDEDSVEHATAHYAAENLSFEVASIAELPFADGSFDLITSFETFEHVDSDTQDRFLSETRRVLAPGGVLVISTPEKSQATDLAGVVNEFHVCELYEDEFLEKMGAHFSNVELYLQNLWVYAEVVRKSLISGLVPVNVMSVADAGQNMIAVCSEGSLPELTLLTRAPVGLRQNNRESEQRIRQHYERSLSWRLTQPLRRFRSFIG